MHSPPSPKAHLDTVTLTASAVGAATVLKDTANVPASANNNRDAASRTAAHHSAPRKPGAVDMHLISQQISELATRVDTLESSMKTDIRTILEMLQHQHNQQPPTQTQHFSATGRPVPRINPQPPVVPERQMTNTYQTDSEFSSFDLGLGGGPEKTLQHQSSSASYGGTIAVGTATGAGALQSTPTQHKQHQQQQQQRVAGGGGNVQRSISQPECANERNLFT